MLSNRLRVNLHDVVQCKQTQILEVLIGILDEGPQLSYAEAHQRYLVRETNDASLDAFIEERHGRSGVD